MKIKLNAVLASVLSLGVVCSSSVFAAKQGSGMPSGFGSQQVPILTRQNATIVSFERQAAAILLNEQRSSLVRQNATINSRMAYEPQMGSRLRRGFARTNIDLMNTDMDLWTSISKLIVTLKYNNVNYNTVNYNTVNYNIVNEFASETGIDTLPTHEEFVIYFADNRENIFEILVNAYNTAREKNLKDEKAKVVSLIDMCFRLMNQIDKGRAHFRGK